MRASTLFCLGCIFVLMISLSGCAVGMAAMGKTPKNTTILTTGRSRLNVISELGKPDSSFTNGKGEKVDMWVITKGNEPSALRSFLHGLLDIGTFGLWEILGTPIELYASKEDKYQYLVTYDKDNNVKLMERTPIKKPLITADEE